MITGSLSYLARQSGFLFCASFEMMSVSADFRKIALIVILLRAGFELHRDTLHRVGRAALIMSCLPAVFEIA